MISGWPDDGITIDYSTILVTLLVSICLLARICLPSEITTDEETKEVTLAFFHPNCDHGGGGERVLWVMIDALLKEDVLSKKLCICIYSSKDSSSKSAILAGVNLNFGINLGNHADRISLVHIRSSILLDAKWYPVATMLCQSLASVFVGAECLFRRCPDVYCDTMGCAFTYPCAKFFFGCTVVAYIHYPIISSDMLQRVRDQRPAHSENGTVSGNISISAAKLVYYQFFAYMYTFVGSFADEAIVNSSWTENHISQLWGLELRGKELELNLNPEDSSKRSRPPNHRTKKVVLKIYPPCNTTHLQEIPLGDETTRQRIILSVGQFRPEKDHVLQLRAFKALNDISDRFRDIKLVMVGSTRNEEDRSLVASLKSEAKALGILCNVVFVVDAPFSVLHGWLRVAQVGLHTMWNEHFGISVVEMMAAGLVTVAHNSGGPKLDLIKSVPAPFHSEDDSTSSHNPSGEVCICTGYLATTALEYAECIAAALDHYTKSIELRRRARISSSRFSDQHFMADVVKVFIDAIK